MAFFLDEDVNPAAARAGRSMGLDVVSVHELDRNGIGDREQLEFSAREQRIFVTRNRDDFIQLTVSAYQASEPHPGIVIIPYSIPNKDPGRIARALKQWQDEHGETPTPYAILFLSDA